jgi:alpha-methylacyl-CoA racemase
MSVGPLEPQFYDEFTKLLGLEDPPDRYDFDRTEELRGRIADVFVTRTQEEWVAVFEGSDACVAGVFPLSEAIDHPHLSARGVFVEHEGIRQPAPAPRFSRTGSSLGLPPAATTGLHTREALAAWGVRNVDALIEKGVAVQT